MLQRYRVLVVDDNVDTLELIRMALAEEYDVLTLSNPLGVYDCIDLFEPDLLILDIMMPKITGYQLIELLRKNPKTKDIPIIVLSAKSNIREIKHGYKLGAALYLTKPFDPERLLKNTETQFRMHPPEQRRKALSLDQVRIRLEVLESARTGQIALSSSLLTLENVRQKKGRESGETGKQPGAAPEEKKEGEGMAGPRWEG